MIWQVYVRYPGAEEDWAAECYAMGFVAIGWNEVGDLSKIQSSGEIKERLIKAYDNYYYYKDVPRSVDSDAGNLWRFACEIASGDLVLTPDAKGKRYYVGKIQSGYFFQDEQEKNDTCPFLHRRRVQWLGAILRAEAQHIWGRGRIGSIQTVARLRDGEDRLRRILGAKAKRKPKRAIGTSGKPDPIWGRAAEERALIWLSDQGFTPKDVTELNLGWDIECGKVKYEVKGRRSPKTVIRLTENEFKMAQKYKDKYVILLFTARSMEELKQSIPEKIPDPVRTRDWSVRTIREYILVE